jgi:hypothetical protein
MPKSGKTFTTLFIVAGMCLIAGIYLCISAATNDPIANSPMVLVGGATFIGFGLAAAYMGVQSFLHHRAVILHITRRNQERGRVRVRKRRTPHTDVEDQSADVSEKFKT